VRQHPVTGRKAIYTGYHASHIYGMPQDEGRCLLEELDSPDLPESAVYTHDWRPGDVVIWDNRSVQHRQLPYDDGADARVMRRAAIADSDVRVPVSA
jgi:alpha-ketoglutarate-dependent taurine dioxygenase